MRRFAIHPDYLQSVPKNAREPYRSKGRKAKDTAREAATDSTPAPDSANAPQDRIARRTSPRQHWARVIGAATLSSLLVFCMAVTPGPKPAPEPRVSPGSKIVAKGLNNRNNAVYALGSAARIRKSVDRKPTYERIHEARN
jgi:hypothetical protein